MVPIVNLSSLLSNRHSSLRICLPKATWSCLQAHMQLVRRPGLVALLVGTVDPSLTHSKKGRGSLCRVVVLAQLVSDILHHLGPTLGGKRCCLVHLPSLIPFSAALLWCQLPTHGPTQGVTAKRSIELGCSFCCLPPLPPFLNAQESSTHGLHMRVLVGYKTCSIVRRGSC